MEVNYDEKWEKLKTIKDDEQFFELLLGEPIEKEPLSSVLARMPEIQSAFRSIGISLNDIGRFNSTLSKMYKRD